MNDYEIEKMEQFHGMNGAAYQDRPSDYQLGIDRDHEAYCDMMDAAESGQLIPDTIIQTVYGEWVQVVSQHDNMVTVDTLGKYSHRKQIHLSKFMVHTAMQKPLNVR